MAPTNAPPPNRAAKIVAMQALATEGLDSGVSDRSMAELRDAARRQAGKLRG